MERSFFAAMRARMLSVFVPASIIIAGCSGSVAQTTASDAALEGGSSTRDGGPSGNDSSISSGDSGAVDAGTHDASTPDTGYDAGPPGTVTGSLSIGPMHLDPGEERTVCVTIPLTAARDFVLTSLNMSLGAGTHHAIAYRSTATTASPTMVDCPPLNGITDGTAPIIIAQHDGDSLALPSGVGLPMSATQMIELELHGINTTHDPLDVVATVNMSGPDAAHATALQQADLSFWGTMNIAIPAHSTWSTGIQFQPGIAGTHGFAVTTHQHRLGTDFKVWKSTDGTDVTESSPTIVDNTDWADPKTFYFSPTLDFDGTDGLAYQCTWNNTTDNEVDFGESALNEMCFLWMYYYPSHGFDVCLTTPCSR